MSADRVNVVIVGGGIIGCFVAYYLASAGVRVTVLERGPLCGEASSASAGMVTVSSREGSLLELARESLRLIARAAEEIETDFELARIGSLILLRTEEEVHQKRSFVERQRRSGVDIQLLDRTATLALEPAASPEIVGAVYSPADWAVSPYALTVGLAQAVRQLGATIRTGVEVTGLKAEGGRVRTAVTPEGDVSGDYVVMAAGAWSPGITRTVGLNLPIEPSRGQILVTEPSPPPTRSTIRDTGHIYVRPTVRGNYVIGSMTEKVGFNKGLTPAKMREYSDDAIRLVPSIRHARIMRGWAGLRPLTPDNQPLLGKAEGYDGLVLASGHSRTGITFSAVTSKMVADFITEGTSDFSLEPFGLSRFPVSA